MPRNTLAALIPVLLLTAPAMAQSAKESPGKGEEVSIPFATHGGIYNYVPDRGGDGVYLEDNFHHWYYADFAPRCLNLDYAVQIGFRTWAGTSSLSRGDTIFAGGERCHIMSLKRSDPPPEAPKKARKQAAKS